MYDRDILTATMSFFADICSIYMDNVIELPDVTALDLDPLQLISIIVSLSLDPEHPITNPMTCVRVMRAADFLGADTALEYLRERLNCSPDMLANSVPVSRQLKFIRSRYRMTEYNRLKSKDKGVCGLCSKSLYKALPSRSFTETVIKSPCCGLRVHAACHTDTQACHLCGQELSCLPCVFCGQQIRRGGTFYESYEERKKSR